MPSMVRVLTAIALAMLLPAAAAQAAPRKVPHGFHGVMWDRAATRAPAADLEQQWALMAQSGVESVRTVFSWARAQPTAGTPPDLTGTDQLVGLAARHNIRLLPIVIETPDWAAKRPVQGAPPAHVGAYTAFLRSLVLRYGPTGSFWDEHPELPRRPLREWQIWNEPHLDFYWNSKGRSWARGYAPLLRASKRAIESVDRRATIVLAAMADFAWRHLDRLNRRRVRRHFDVAALNFFTSRPKNVMKGVRYFRRALARGREKRKPIWITETTWPAAKDRVPPPSVPWQRSWYTTDEGQASRLGGLYRLAARNRRKFRLQRVYWYTWASAYGDGDLFDYAGLTRYSGGVFEPRPALQAFTASAQSLQGCVKTPEGACSP
jgi:polysaccharide biosynthesis protein PslG